MEYHAFWLLKNSSFKPSRNGKYGKPKNWWKDDVYWLLKSSCFKLFEDGKYSLLLAKVLMEKWYSVITGKYLFWTFWRWGTRSFLSQKVDGKMVFPLSFWTFHDIPGLGKYGFLCSAKDKLYQWKDKLSLLLARSEALFIIDDNLADENPNKQRQSLLELAISSGHRSH